MPKLIKFYSKQNAGVYCIDQFGNAALFDFHAGNHFITAMGNYSDSLDIFYVGY